MYRRWNPDFLEEGPVLSREGRTAPSNSRPVEASPIPPTTLLTVPTYLRASSSARPPLPQQDTQYQQHLRDALHHAAFASQQAADVLEILQRHIPKDNLLAPNTQLERQSIQPLQTAAVATPSQIPPPPAEEPQQIPIEDVPTRKNTCSYCYKDKHNIRTCTFKGKGDYDLSNNGSYNKTRIRQLIHNHEQPEGQLDLHVAAWLDQEEGLKEGYVACIKVCPVWKDIYATPNLTHHSIRDGFLYCRPDKQWKLVLPTSFVYNGKNFLEIAIQEAHDATAHGGVEKTMKTLTDKFMCQSFSTLVKDYVSSCDTCQHTKYYNKPPVGLVTPLHVPIRPVSDLSMDFLKLTPVFIKCSVVYPYIPFDEHHVVCISRIGIIVDRQSGFKFLIPVSDNFTAEQCTATFDIFIAPTISYPLCLVFNRDTIFTSFHFMDWAARKGIKLEPSTSYHPQADSQTYIINKEILQVARACKVEGDQWLQKIPEIQLKLNSRYDAARKNSPFLTLFGFDAKIGLSSVPYPVNPYVTTEERHSTTSQHLHQSKIKQAHNAYKRRTEEP